MTPRTLLMTACVAGLTFAAAACVRPMPGPAGDAADPQPRQSPGGASAHTQAPAAPMPGSSARAVAPQTRPAPGGGATAPAGAEPPQSPSVAPGDWRLIWSDEFDGDKLDDTKWVRWVGRAYNSSAELQNFTSSHANAFVRDGVLTIRAIKETTSVGARTAHYTSAQLITRTKASWTYGRFEARLKAAPGYGTHTVFWMMPEVDKWGWWPDSGEIDIVEVIGREPRTVHAALHWSDGRHVSTGGRT